MKRYKVSMKILAPLSIAWLVSGCGSSEDPAYLDTVKADTAVVDLKFADSGLNACVKRESRRQGWKTVGEVTSLTCDSQEIGHGEQWGGVSSTEGLAVFPNLKHLTFINQRSIFDTVRELTALESIDWRVPSSGGVTFSADLSLPKAPNLKKLVFRGGNSYVDLKPLYEQIPTHTPKVEVIDLTELQVKLRSASDRVVPGAVLAMPSVTSVMLPFVPSCLYNAACSHPEKFTGLQVFGQPVPAKVIDQLPFLRVLRSSNLWRTPVSGEVAVPQQLNFPYMENFLALGGPFDCTNLPSQWYFPVVKQMEMGCGVASSAVSTLVFYRNLPHSKSFGSTSLEFPMKTDRLIRCRAMCRPPWSFPS
jgi:hypothetical protein